jgi:hypothetical protein
LNPDSPIRKHPGVRLPVARERTRHRDRFWRLGTPRERRARRTFRRPRSRRVAFPTPTRQRTARIARTPGNARRAHRGGAINARR